MDSLQVYIDDADRRLAELWQAGSAYEEDAPLLLRTFTDVLACVEELRTEIAALKARLGE